MKRQIRAWHPGKIAMLWFFAIVVLGSMLWNQGPARVEDALIGSLIICFPVIVITWIWLGGREKE